MNIYAQTELEAIKRDAYSNIYRVDGSRRGVASALNAGGTCAVATNAELLDPRPEPWWRNIRKEALEEYKAEPH
jgi:hypothetical protein